METKNPQKMIYWNVEQRKNYDAYLIPASYFSGDCSLPNEIDGKMYTIPTLEKWNLFEDKSLPPNRKGGPTDPTHFWLGVFCNAPGVVKLDRFTLTMTQTDQYEIIAIVNTQETCCS
jgi:hypothetical protein